MQGQVITPSYVAGAQASAYNSSNGRTQAAMTMSEPGSLVS
jgi:hypothetical protein